MPESGSLDKEIRIRAFRAIDDPETCRKFIEGHRRVLSIYGIENITTNTDDWMFRRSIYVIVVETLDGSKLYGGVRIQIADGIHPLPIEEATGKMDPRIYEIVREHAKNGAAELSGLWNSKEVAGLGIGSLFPSRVAMAMATQVGVNTFFTLCSPTTVRFKDWMGGKILDGVGKEGTFYYPKIDLIATAVYSDDMFGLTATHPREREKIIYLRENLEHIAKEKSPFKDYYTNIHYALILPNADPKEFQISYEPYLHADKHL
ncbi:MAG: hypothetical protein V4557_00945 [Bacteroidota bacterium]